MLQALTAAIPTSGLSGEIMRIRYRETQYLHPMWYIAIAVLVGLNAIVVARQVAAGAGATSVALAAASGVVLLMFFPILGRVRVSVDSVHIKIEFGWLKVVTKTIELAMIREVRVRVLRPSADIWGSGFSRTSFAGFAARSRRVVEIVADGERTLIGCQDPQALRQALLPAERQVDDRPEYEREAVQLPYTRTVSGNLNWGLINPKNLQYPAETLGLNPRRAGS